MATSLRKIAKPATACKEAKAIIIPLDAYRSERYAEVKVTGGISSENPSPLPGRALKTLTEERSY
jgi:hypothetical protein